MNKLEALTALRDKVKAGQALPKDVLAVFPHYVGDCGQWAHDAYYHGSLDAAKALHEAVLPGHRARIDVGRRFRAWVITPSNKKHDAYSKTPARAWLLAILEALIAQEQDT